MEPAYYSVMMLFASWSFFAFQVLGGYGYCDEYQVERLWRDAKLLEIGGGTLEAHHKNMVSYRNVCSRCSVKIWIAV